VYESIEENYMNIRNIPTEKLIRERDACQPQQSPVWQRPLSRRQFARTAAGAAMLGAALGAGWWRPERAAAHNAHAPVPIPGGTPLAGGGFHVFAPGTGPGFDPPDAEPSTITNFNGFIGLAFISGEVTRTNTATGEVRTLPFVNNDMRFMKGVFRGTDGKTHQGSFVFV
jgi:hypothetical protein